MENKKIDTYRESERSTRVLVWDLPTRLFHWLLLICVILSFVTGIIGGNAMEYHLLSGYTILVLLIFRLAWGFVGSRTARFSSFVKGPATVLAHVATLLKKKTEDPYLGHNPLGGWSIVAMLLVMFVQVATGLFANPAITEGAAGLFFGNPGQLWIQVVSIVATAAYSAAGTLIVIAVTKLLAGGLRVDEDSEISGLDNALHGERGFEIT